MISKSEHGKVGYYNQYGELIAVLTANLTETMFFLYEFDGKDYKKLGKSDNPIELEKKYGIKERMGVKNE